MIEDTLMDLHQINRWADFWRNEIGVNVIPAVSINKKPLVSWKEDPRGNWQEEPIPQSLHDEWKNKGMFKSGMAIICGRVFRGKNEGKYLCAIDCDNRLAIDEMTKDLKRMSEKTIVEQHKDNPNKAHFYFYTTKPMPKKSSDTTSEKLSEKINDNEVPAIEMKGEGQHGIMYCTPSMHKNGERYQILGVKELVIFDGIGDVVKGICDKYKLGTGGDNNKVPMKVLMDNETKVVQGHNRHEAIMRYAESILRKYPRMESQMFRDMIILKNNRMCQPPLSEDEIDVQIECAVNYIEKQLKEEYDIIKNTKFKYGSTEFWRACDEYGRNVNTKPDFGVKCLECNKEIKDIDPFDNTHRGHRVVLK